MKAYHLDAYVGPSALRLSEIAEPAATENEVLIDVRAIGVNFPDLLITQGLYQLKPELPFVPGCEVAGTVRAAPTGSTWQPGDRVAAFIWQGGFAEQALVPIHHLVAIPEVMDFADAAAMQVNYHTVFFGLKRRGNLQPGESVLVLGAAGGIGSAAVQIAKGLGARVIAGVLDETQASVAHAAGADAIVTLEVGFAQEVHARTDGLGVDLVVDPLGSWLFEEATRALAAEGRILVVGFAAGEVPTVKTNRFLLKNISMIGVAWGARIDADNSVLSDGAAALHSMVADSKIRPIIGRRFAFSELPNALDLLSAGAIAGKAVVEMPSP